MKKGFLSSTLLLLLTFMPIAGVVQAQDDASGQVYVVQNGDGLYKLSRKFFGDLTGVRKIVKAHNEKAAVDERFKPIDTKKQLELGQKLWIPVAKSDGSATLAAPESKPLETVKKDPPKVKPQTQPDSQPDSTANVDKVVSEEIAKAKANEQAGVVASSDQAILVKVPKTNCEIRVWYNYQVVAIGRLNERWKANGMSLEERAKRAYTIRHNARVNGRFMMQDRFEVATLRDRDNKKYGNPDGPTFDYLINYHKESGFSGDEVFERIIESSSRTSPVFNNECQ